MLRTLAIAALTTGLALSVLPSCASDQHYSQTELNALESREFRAGFDQTFDASVGALFDLGYMIRASDKRGGVINAGSVQLKLDQLGPGRTSVRVSTSHGGQVRVDKPTIEKILEQIDRRLTGAPPVPPSSSAPAKR